MAKASKIVSLVVILSLAALALPLPSANVARALTAEYLFEQYNRVGCGNTALVYGANRQWAQTFTAQSTHTVTSVKLPLGRNGSPGFVTVAIHVSIDFLKAPRNGGLLTVTCSQNLKGKVGQYTMVVEDDEGTVIALCNGWARRTMRPLVPEEQEEFNEN